eukprot:1229_1
MLTPKSWKYICEISLKASNHYECVSFLDDVITRYRHVAKLIAWKEFVKVLLIKRSFDKVIEYSSFICEHIIENKDYILLDMTLHAFKMSLKKKHKKMKKGDINNMLHCIDALHSHDPQKRSHLYSLITPTKKSETPPPRPRNPNHVVHRTRNVSAYEMSDVSMDFVDMNEQKECELIAFKLNCVEIESRSIGNDMDAHVKHECYLSIFEWIFYSSS